MEVSSPGSVTQPVSAATRSASGDSPLSLRVQSLRLPAQKLSTGVSGWVGWLFAVLFAGSTVWLFLFPVGHGAKSETSPSPEVAALREKLRSASAGTATSGVTDATASPSIVLESKGYIIPEQQILVSPQVSGRVIELNFDAGDRVKEGDVLAVLDSTEYRADLDRANGMVAATRARYNELDVGSRPDEIVQAHSELDEAETTLEQAERDYLRMKGLRRQNVATIQEYEQTESMFRAQAKRVARLEAALRLMQEGPRQERVLAAMAELQQAEAEVRRSTWRLENTTIRAPISGTILKKNAELGNLVNPIAFNGSFSLCDIADLSKLEVELTIQERDISKVFAGQACKLRAEAFPKRIYEGVVSRLMPIADRAKGAIPVRVRIEMPPGEEGQYLKPEMGAIVQFFSNSRETVVNSDLTDQAVSNDPASALTPANVSAVPRRL